MDRISDVVILGGGTAGWMTASYLAKALQGTVTITVIEAPSVPRIGVGEATVPNLHSAFFHFLGMSEADWMRECNASFKAGIRFVNWRTPGAGQAQPRPFTSGSDSFYHHFATLPENDHIPLSHYWFRKRQLGETDQPFDRECFAESATLDAKKGPRYADSRRAYTYAWHFDAQLVANFLCRWATTTMGVHHIQEEMSEVLRDERGYITALRLKSGREVAGELFVDCSGFRGLLINQALGEPFVDMGDQLLCDSAVATAVPHDDAAHGVEPYTSAIAMSSGWTWKIPMLTRFGTGYVYSSKFSTKDDATAEFCQMWGLDPTETPLNHIRFRVGRNRRAWVNNCVSIGLASCFVEPLESTGIFFIYSALYQLVKHFPDRGFDPTLSNRFNREIESMFDFTRDFIQAHFYFSPRTDTEFWLANKKLPLGPDMQEKIELYRAGLPVNTSLTGESPHYGNPEVEHKNYWNNSNYWCIFAGLGFLPDHVMPTLRYRPASAERAETLFQDVRRRERTLLDELPTTYELLQKLHGR
jgi:tryptophan halogenase